MQARFTISNMAIEVGAKAGLMEADETTCEWLSRRTSALPDPVFADPQATYTTVYEFEVSKLAPQIAFRHAVDQVVPVEEVEGLPIDQGILGTCNAARLEDFHNAAAILRGQRICKGGRFFVIPSSKSVMLEIIEDGTLRTLLDAGAVLGTPGCSGCMGGASFAVPADGMNVISTANRNFKGRLGNPRASIYLASPATVAASVLEGRIADPRKYV
jgi:3-isopropylmalate/(R)-2-methylmalate dehydratase large subunit